MVCLIIQPQAGGKLSLKLNMTMRPKVMLGFVIVMESWMFSLPTDMELRKSVVKSISVKDLQHL